MVLQHQYLELSNRHVEVKRAELKAGIEVILAHMIVIREHQVLKYLVLVPLMFFTGTTIEQIFSSDFTIA